MTGCGKTTLIDVHSFIKADHGEIIVDNQNLYDSKESSLYFLAAISHVPQIIYLNDSTISENIAFIDNKEDLILQELEKQQEWLLESSLNHYQKVLKHLLVRGAN